MKNYDPSQPRVPKGQSTGGQWTDDASVASSAARVGAGLPPASGRQSEIEDIAEWSVTKDGKVLVAKPLTPAERKLWGGARRGHNYLGVEPDPFDDDDNFGRPVNEYEFRIRGIYGKLPDRSGKKWDIVTFYFLNGNETILFDKYYDRILTKINDDPDYHPVVYYSINFFNYLKYDPRNPS